jgi:hypothetical protein
MFWKMDGRVFAVPQYTKIIVSFKTNWLHQVEKQLSPIGLKAYDLKLMVTS